MTVIGDILVVGDNEENRIHPPADYAKRHHGDILVINRGK